MPNHVFPSKFVWGVAAAAPQIEGAVARDGKGESVWDRFAAQPGRINHGDTLEPACDHYRLFRRDFALMRRLGIRHYRLSFAWPRIFPTGDGAPNRKGLDFYHRVLDSLERNEITPWVTMFHWDLPQALEDRGGWRARATVDAFARYADTIVQAYGDRVKRWITLNEITCFTTMAYGGRSKAPGLQLGPKVVNQTKHHALLAHGHGVRAVREFGGRGAQVGLADNCSVAVPVTETPGDVAAARAWFAAQNESLLDPIYRGRYAAGFLRRCGATRPRVRPGDFKLIGLPTDFLGLNIYSGAFIRRGNRGRPEALRLPKNYPRTDSDWLNLLPQALHWGPRFAHEVYGAKAIYITENGCGYDDEPVVRAEVHDLHRRDYLRNYLGELHHAITDGVPVKGYFLWSFMDNFEWTDGYTRRFGIVHVDYRTQRRTPKLSAHWYASVIRENRLV